MTARYVVGIDLGTTNTAVAYAQLGDAAAAVSSFPIPQLIAPAELAPRPTLPSFLYLPGPELPPAATTLPWGTPGWVVGELARTRGGEVPARLVSSAKSWLVHAGVDRTAPILPVLQGDDAIARVSPVEVAARYLGHVRAAWDHHFAAGGWAEGAALADQEIFLTVPASFDAVARELTARAAREAGLANVTLLEEPQAAFYAWLAKKGDAWRKELEVGDVVLVCDVGGGTTDFSLIAAIEREGSLDLERVAVGDHILLGGDNMDLALAYRVRQRLEGEGHTLDAWQTAALTHACRGAKEQLLSGAERAPVTILGRGSKLIGGSIRAEILRAEVEELLVDGFFPLVDASARPENARRTALRTIGLPYASDAAVTRHLAAFVGAHRRATAVLFNGGVMKAHLLQRRITETLDSWSDSPEDDLKVLSGTDLDLAVAEGAAYYGLVRHGRGVRIRGGTARAYYIGIESSEPAVPGVTPPLRALCVAPFGMEEGTELVIDAPELGLVVGEPVEFRFLTSSTRREDRAGAFVDVRGDALTELAPVEATLEGNATGELVPVTLRARLDEVGTLQLSCVERGGKAHELSYNLRERDSA